MKRRETSAAYWIEDQYAAPTGTLLLNDEEVSGVDAFVCELALVCRLSLFFSGFVLSYYLYLFCACVMQGSV